jgi:hypothetical protein
MIPEIELAKPNGPPTTPTTALVTADTGLFMTLDKKLSIILSPVTVVPGPLVVLLSAVGVVEGATSLDLVVDPIVEGADVGVVAGFTPSAAGASTSPAKAASTAFWEAVVSAAWSYVGATLVSAPTLSVERDVTAGSAKTEFAEEKSGPRSTVGAILSNCVPETVGPGPSYPGVTPGSVNAPPKEVEVPGAVVLDVTPLRPNDPIEVGPRAEDRDVPKPKPGIPP